MESFLSKSAGLVLKTCLHHIYLPVNFVKLFARVVAFTYSKSTMETREQRVSSVQNQQ